MVTNLIETFFTEERRIQGIVDSARQEERQKIQAEIEQIKAEIKQIKAERE